MTTNSKIYNSFQDTISKNIFKHRLLYSYTGESEHHKNVLKEIGVQLHELHECKKILFANGERRIIIYGVGVIGGFVKNILDLCDIKVTAFCDSDKTKHEKTSYGLECISVDNLIQNHNTDMVVIAVANASSINDIKLNLLDLGFPPDNIIPYWELFSAFPQDMKHSQYFDEAIPLVSHLPENQKHVFVDAGCFDFYDSTRFVNWCDGEYSKIIAFEPNPQQYPVCLERAKDLQNITIYPFGLWHEDTTLYFENQYMASAAKITDSETSGVQVEVKNLDDILNGDFVSFIKMDIEGAELNALKGAEKTILKHRPILAISLYHKSEDILTIPEYILSLHSDYKLYLRHYAILPCETVLYAV